MLLQVPGKAIQVLTEGETIQWTQEDTEDRRRTEGDTVLGRRYSTIQKVILQVPGKAIQKKRRRYTRRHRRRKEDRSV